MSIEAQDFKRDLTNRSLKQDQRAETDDLSPAKAFMSVTNASDIQTNGKHPGKMSHQVAKKSSRSCTGRRYAKLQAFMDNIQTPG